MPLRKMKGSPVASYKLNTNRRLKTVLTTCRGVRADQVHNSITSECFSNNINKMVLFLADPVEYEWELSRACLDNYKVACRIYINRCVAFLT
ncbi:Hypothetical predicted protein [Octopus vulgaris]|uniref:Uncharacterized protein n=1 Tax=Octopus vulgaris TaxID=6645 RepID=A0AA36AX33_OCTVU|nr:Hypothetical predicted protein [Octopus vulgaris]